MEIWKPIKDYPDYEVSNLGNVRSVHNTYESTFKGKPIIRTKKTNLVGSKLTRKGYKRVNLKGKIYFVHRVVAETFLSNPNNYRQVNHLDGDKLNNCVTNLEWCSNQQNRDHAVRLNLVANRQNGFCKITVAQVSEIKELRSQGLSQKEVARLYNVCQQTISKILTTL